MKTYEALFIFPTSLKDEAFDGALGRVGEEIERLGGSVTKTDVVGRRSFARPMNKKDHGVYVNMNISLAPDAVDQLLRRLKLNPDVFRVQIMNETKVPEPVVEEEAAAEKEETPDGDA